MSKQTFNQALESRAKHVMDIIGQVPEWNGTNGFKDYNVSKPLDSILTESDLVWFFQPENQRGRVEFQDIKFKGYGPLDVSQPQEYDKENIVVVDKTVDNRDGGSPIITKMEWKEEDTKTQEAGFKASITLAAELGFEAGTEYAKFSAKISSSATTEWDKRNIAAHSEALSISEEVGTPPGVHERIQIILEKVKMRERITGKLDLEHKIVVASARPDNSYYYVLVWDSFADFLRCVNKTAPNNWTGAKELRKVNLRQINRDCIGNPTDATIDTWNEFENCLSLKVVRHKLNSD